MITLNLKKYQYKNVNFEKKIPLCILKVYKHLSVNPTKCKKMLNTLKQLVGKLPMNCLNVFDHFVGLALKGSS